jgi:hypothetical protein
MRKEISELEKDTLQRRWTKPKFDSPGKVDLFNQS